MLRKSLAGAAAVAAVMIAVTGLVARAQDARPTPNGGNGTLYIGGYPNQIYVIDEATEKITATIPVQVGIPRRLAVSQDLKRLYVLSAEQEELEILDNAGRKTIDRFKLSEGNKTVRINSFSPDPTDRYVILITRTNTKLNDRWEIGNSVMEYYDLAQHKVTRTIPWPDGQERDNANLLFSPDGKLLYFLGNEVLIFETTDFKQVDKWDMSNLEEGLGQASLNFGGFGGADNTNDEPGFFTTTMTVEDPVQHRRLMGVARINLTAKTNDFYTLGPAGGVSFTLAPDRKHGYGLESEIGRYQFWTFDLVNRQVTSRAEFEGRPRMSLKTSSNGQLLYIYVAGNTIDVYEAATYRHLRTIELPGDQTTQLMVVPPRANKP
jgi:YVTN family beta-propeller protein